MSHYLQTATLKLKRGFSLVELLVYMGLISILLIVLVQIFVSILETQSESQATSVVDQDGRFIMARLIYDIARSSSIETPLDFGESSPVLELVIDGVSHTYSASSGLLVLSNNLGANNLNSSQTDISDVSFLKVGEAGATETISLSFVLTSKVSRPSGPEVATFETTVERR